MMTLLYWLRRRWWLAAMGAAAGLCVVGACVLAGAAAMSGGGGAPMIPSLLSLRQAQEQACPAPAQLVPGSFQADPVQKVGDYVLVTYAAECDLPNRPREYVEGFVANAPNAGCGGRGTGSSNGMRTVGHGGTILELTDTAACSSGPGGGGLTLARGRVTGADAVSVAVTFANGTVVNGPVQASGRFVVAAPAYTAVCTVAALDASGAVLAEFSGSPMFGPSHPGGCP